MAPTIGRRGELGPYGNQFTGGADDGHPEQREGSTWNQGDNPKLLTQRQQSRHSDAKFNKSDFRSLRSLVNFVFKNIRPLPPRPQTS